MENSNTGHEKGTILLKSRKKLLNILMYYLNVKYVVLVLYALMQVMNTMIIG